MIVADCWIIVYDTVWCWYFATVLYDCVRLLYCLYDFDRFCNIVYDCVRWWIMCVQLSNCCVWLWMCLYDVTYVCMSLCSVYEIVWYCNMCVLFVWFSMSFDMCANLYNYIVKFRIVLFDLYWCVYDCCDCVLWSRICYVLFCVLLAYDLWMIV